MHHFDSERTAQLLDFGSLVDALARAASEREAGLIVAPERQVLPLGAGGVLLSMPATAADIGIHKLVTVQAANAARGLPIIHGVVTVCEAATGRPLALLDGPVLTGRRTAALSMLAVRTLLPTPPRCAVLIGKGVQAHWHVLALQALYPACQIRVQGRDAAATAARCAEWRRSSGGGGDIQPSGTTLPADCDLVITLTTATQPVYNEAPQPGRLVIGVGAFKPEMAEIGPTTLHGSSLIADDPAGARHEAGDLLRAGVDWAQVTSLGAVLARPAGTAWATGQPHVFKSVGAAAWDLAAARVALAHC